MAVVPPTIRSCSSALNVRYGPAPQATLVSLGPESTTTGAVLGTTLGLDVVLSGTHHGLVVLGFLLEVLAVTGFAAVVLVAESGTHQGLVVLGREVVDVTTSGTHHGLVVLGRLGREVVTASGTHHGLVVLGREVVVGKGANPAPATDGLKGK